VHYLNFRFKNVAILRVGYLLGNFLFFLGGEGNLREGCVQSVISQTHNNNETIIIFP